MQEMPALECWKYRNSNAGKSGLLMPETADGGAQQAPAWAATTINPVSGSPCAACTHPRRRRGGR